MIDLHLHLDGSLPAAFIGELAGNQGVALPENLEKALKAPENCQSLDEYLQCFELPLSLLQNVEALEQAAFTLCSLLYSQGLLYGEIRFAPQLHTRKGLTQRQAAEAVCRGAAQAALPVQVILCCMRGGPYPVNRETLDTAAALLGKGVCACDLAGAEGLYPTEEYRELFACARSLGLPFTIHAGEAAGPGSIRAALEMGAARIGHGVRAGEDSALLQELAARQVPLEMCLTSNVQTKAIKSPESFPLREYLQKGLCCTANTDNMTVSGVNLREEYKKLAALGLTGEEKEALLINAARAAFLPEEKRLALEKEARAKGDNWPA